MSHSKTSTDKNPVYEMLWDCQYCGSTQLLGKTQRFCPQCGSGQDPDSRYYPADDEKIAVHEHQYVGADVTCGACDHPNSANSEFCTQCGSPLDQSKAVATRPLQSREAEQHFDTGSNKKQTQKATETDPELVPTQPFFKRWYVIVIILASITALLVLAFWTKPITLQATGFAWERVIYIKKYAVKNAESWCDSLPSSAYSVHQTQKIKSYKHVADGETCQTQRLDQGDGTYKEQQACEPTYRQEPVYAQSCHYKINKWVTHRSVITKANDKKPVWGSVDLSCPNQKQIGCEREARRDSHYLIQLDDKQNNYSCNIEESLWEKSLVGSAWRMNISAITGKQRCHSLVPVQ